ncbi:MAG: cupin domain-containing protein [Rhodoferax sp.]|nr:cupin domain-containing protein [Rhodoferax sp.]
MEVNQPLKMLGDLSPVVFMKRHWQKKPLLIRQAFPGFQPLLDRATLFELAAREGVESRLVIQQNKTPKKGSSGAKGSAGWLLKHGPFARRALPPLNQPGWSLLVQGVDLHCDAAHVLLNRFRFVPDARLDDLMISYATDGGGVGPHFDSYDVFLLQALGTRRWRIGRQKNPELQEGVPLKILTNFEPELTYDLEPGDMLYLPPGYAHDGVAVGECMTYSIGFRVPKRSEVAQELLQRLAEDAPDLVGDALYRDAGQAAVDSPGQIPSGLFDFARDALQAALQDPKVMERALGEYLTEPKANVWFDQGQPLSGVAAVCLDRRTRMMFDLHHVFINGEGYRAGGRDATLMRLLADRRRLETAEVGRLSAEARELLEAWCESGWVHVD